jgi:hypothetical protein
MYGEDLRVSELKPQLFHRFREQRCKRVIGIARLPHGHCKEVSFFPNAGMKDQPWWRGEGSASAPTLLVLFRAHGGHAVNNGDGHLLSSFGRPDWIAKSLFDDVV